MKRIVLLIMLSCVALMWFSCSEDDPTAGFSTITGEGDESVSQDTIVINFGKTLSESMTISFQLGGAAALDGDYTLSFPSVIPDYDNTTALTTVTVKAGESSLTMVINIIDDSYVEPFDEEIYILITSVSDDKVASWIKSDLYTYVIHDNDSPPSDGLQADLSWYLGNGISINQVNFDLYLVHDVIFDGDENITDYTYVDGISSTATTGFESIKITDDLPDEDYYLLIRYVSGSYDAVATVILSYDNLYSDGSGLISGEYSGEDFFYGPIEKSGSTYGRTMTIPAAWRKQAK